MITLRKSGNKPIIIIFDDLVEDIYDYSISLYCDNNYTTLIQQWDKGEVFERQNILLIPQLQEKTREYPVGIGHLEIKIMDNDGFAVFTTSQSVNIKSRKDMTILDIDEYDLTTAELDDLIAENSENVIKINLISGSASSGTSSGLIIDKSVQKDIRKIYNILENFGNDGNAVSATVKEYIDDKIEESKQYVDSSIEEYKTSHDSIDLILNGGEADHVIKIQGIDTIINGGGSSI